MACLVDQATDLVHPDTNKWGTAFRAYTTPLRSELAAQRSICPETSRYWKVINPNVTNRAGAATAYKLLAGHTAFYHGAPSSAVLKRAGFLKNHLWVTKYSPREKYPAGDFPNQNTDEGLPVWTRRNAYGSSNVLCDVVLTLTPVLRVYSSWQGY